tara:strand:- start:297 stop:1355 length:1059 start_codon:yes stop_codon:yes gene_type:complete
MARYLGGLITADESQVLPANNYGDTSAPGVWTLAEAELLNKSNRWPTAGNAAPRGLFAGGYTSVGSGVTDTISYISILSTGNTTNFGDLSVARYGHSAFASGTRGVFVGGDEGGTIINKMEYVTIATTGDTTDFGDLSVARWLFTATSNSTRGLSFGGTIATGTGYTDVIDYVTIASTGNATDFGDLSGAVNNKGSVSSSTRGVIGGGYQYAVGVIDVIEYVTIASTGNATDFGDLTSAQRQFAEGNISSGTRGIYAGGATGNVIQYITIASTGNATDFGDLTVDRNYAGGCGSTTRGVIAGGVSVLITAGIEYITIASTGNGTDFGDLPSEGGSNTLYAFPGCSNSHGGLS